jgi:Holliday junction resolvase RusA-like endonuclease
LDCANGRTGFDQRDLVLDNFNKLWQDALTGIVYEDDSQIAELHLYRDYDKARPRIEIEVVNDGE